MDANEIYPLSPFGFPNSKAPPFRDVVREQKFLFRVFDSSSHVPLSPVEDIACLERVPRVNPPKQFVASQFEGQDIEHYYGLVKPQCTHENFTADLFNHLRWRKFDTPFISASLSLAWAIWEANRRVERGNENVMIAVIDGERQDGEIALRLLDKNANPVVQEARNFANASQEVLVYTYIPADSIISIVAWDEIVLPYWFKLNLQNSLPFRQFYYQFIAQTSRNSDDDFTESMGLASSMLRTNCGCRNESPRMQKLYTKLAAYIYVSRRTMTTERALLVKASMKKVRRKLDQEGYGVGPEESDEDDEEDDIDLSEEEYSNEEEEYVNEEDDEDHISTLAEKIAILSLVRQTLRPKF